MDYESEEIMRLDLEKYGLSHLEGRNLLTLDSADMDRLLVALGNDEISLNMPIPCTPDTVREVLGRSECRRCGKCCLPNPSNPVNPGVEIFEEELRVIADHLHSPHETLRTKTVAGKSVPYAFQTTKLGFTRWLPLPCPFYSADQNGCRVYSVRAVVCGIYPIIFTGDDTYMSIRATCDYGKDVIIGALERLRTSDPNLEITL